MSLLERAAKAAYTEFCRPCAETGLQGPTWEELPATSRPLWIACVKAAFRVAEEEAKSLCEALRGAEARVIVSGVRNDNDGFWIGLAEADTPLEVEAKP